MSDGLPGSKRAVAGSKTCGHAPARGRKQPASCLSDSPVRPTPKRLDAASSPIRRAITCTCGRATAATGRTHFVAIAEALRALPFSRVMLDGEAVAHCLDCRTFTSCRYHVA